MIKKERNKWKSRMVQKTNKARGPYPNQAIISWQRLKNFYKTYNNVKCPILSWNKIISLEFEHPSSSSNEYIYVRALKEGALMSK